MSKFKVGDKVKVLKSDYAEIKVGSIKTVESTNNRGVDLYGGYDVENLYFYNEW